MFLIRFSILKEGNVSKMEENLNFEQSIEKLEKIAEELESGELSLDDSIKKFEDGMELSKKCTEYLENAEKRINILIEKDGEVSEESFCN